MKFEKTGYTLELVLLQQIWLYEIFICFETNLEVLKAHHGSELRDQFGSLVRSYGILGFKPELTIGECPALSNITRLPTLLVQQNCTLINIRSYGKDRCNTITMKRTGDCSQLYHLSSQQIAVNLVFAEPSVVATLIPYICKITQLELTSWEIEYFD